MERAPCDEEHRDQSYGPQSQGMSGIAYNHQNLGRTKEARS